MSPQSVSHAQPAVIATMMPEFRAPQRARLILDFIEHAKPRETVVHEAAMGWAQVDGAWVHWLGDLDRCWESWPMQHVVCIEWEREQ